MREILMLFWTWMLCSATDIQNCSGPSCPDGETQTSSAQDKMAASLLQLQVGLKNLEKQTSTLYQHMSTLLVATNTNLNAQSKHIDLMEKSFTDKISTLLVATNTNLNTQSKRLDLIEKSFSDKISDVEAALNVLSGEASGAKTGIALVSTKVGEIETKVTDNHNKQQKALNYHTTKLDALSKCSCPRDQVFYVRHSADRYKFTFDEAKAACKARGAELAHPEHLEEAWKMGFENCAWGWVSDGSRRYPMHFGNSGCGGYAPGIRVDHRLTLADAYCVKYEWTLS